VAKWVEVKENCGR